MGLAALFFPDEIATGIGLGASAELPLQLASAGLFAIATLNWIGRGAIYGGIYGRPVILANFSFAVVLTGTLVRASLDGKIGVWGWILSAVFLLHTLWAWVVMRSHPNAPASSNESNET
jgi:hypothetical protein